MQWKMKDQKWKGKKKAMKVRGDVENHVAFPGDFRFWEFPQTFPALFIGPFGHVERFRNLKFAIIRIINIESTVPRSSEGTAAIHFAFK